MKRIISAVVFLAIWTLSWAQDVEFTASAPRVVARGEQFRVVFSINANPKNFTPPSFDNFYVLVGPSVSSSSSVQFVNGQMSQAHEYSYTYILEAVDEGVFTLEPAKAEVKKKSYESNELSIEVVKGEGDNAQSQSSQQGFSQQTAQQATGDNSHDPSDIFVSIGLDKSSVYRGEPILATISIYTRVGIAGFEDVKFPSFTGFWSQEVETPSNVHFQRVNLDGRIYNMGVLKKYILFPQQSGDIKIDPFEIAVLTQEQTGRGRSIFDDFFGSYQTVRKNLASKPKTITVKDLPKPAPASFTGAVGSFKMEATLDKEEVKTNEAINLKIRISGNGNLRLIDSPKVNFPNGFEVFDTKVNDRSTTNQQGSSGSKSFDIVAIPRGPGEFDMGEVEFAYFNPIEEKYITLKSKPLLIKVEPDGSEGAQLPLVGFGREDVRFIGKDIRFIKTEGFKPTLGFSFFVSSWGYKLMILLLLLAAFTAFWIIDHRRSLSKNLALVRTRKANKVARQRLKNAQLHLSSKNTEQFYEELMRALWGYVSDKLNIPVSSLSSDSAREALLAQEVDEMYVSQFLELIESCEFARYAPKAEHGYKEKLYQNAIDLISNLEEVLK